MSTPPAKEFLSSLGRWLIRIASNIKVLKQVHKRIPKRQGNISHIRA